MGRQFKILAGGDKMQISIKVIFICILLMIGSVCQTAARNPSEKTQIEAINVLEKYLMLEEKENYKECYSLFSSSHEQLLRKKYTVKNAEEYDNFFKKWEAFWYNSRIKKVKKISNKNAEIVVITTVEESGETETIEKVFFLINEKGQWKINDWKY